MLGRKAVLLLLHIAAVFALPISDTTESDQVIVFTEVQSTEEGNEKPTVLLPGVEDAKNDSTIAEESDKSPSSGEEEKVTTSSELSSEKPTELQPATTEASILVQPVDIPNDCYVEKIFYIRYVM